VGWVIWLRRVLAEFEVNVEKALRIAQILYDFFVRKEGIFAGYSMPEYILPRNIVKGSREHALYLTYVISIDYMTDAEKLWRNARGAYELYPERFTPEVILRLSENTVKRFVRSLGARFAPEAARTWRRISRVLLEKYGGDPRNITLRPLTIDEIKRRLRDFPYLRGPKLSNFYIRVMGETGLFKVIDLEELDIPVDKQVTRFTLYTGVIKLRCGRFQGCVNDDPLKSLIEEIWREAAQEMGIAPWRLDEPIWTIGSKLCAKRRCSKCPVRSYCDKMKGITFRDNIVMLESYGNL